MKKEYILNADLVADIRGHAQEAELRGTLSAAEWELVHQQNWLNLYLPADMKGMGLPLPDALLKLEQLAAVDASLGWTVTLCSGAHWFLGFLEKDLRSALFIKDRLCIAGSGDVGGTAVPLDGGYWVEGSWPHATGAGNATHFSANLCLKGDMAAFLFYADEVELFSNWTTMGMKATASHGFRVRPQWIPANRFFRINPSTYTHPDPVFRCPFELLAAYTLAVNTSGMASRFAELAEVQLSLPETEFYQERNRLLENAHRHWQTLQAGNQVSPTEVQESSRQARQLTALVLRFVQDLYAGMGLRAAREEQEINRVWRNLHTAALHPLLRKLS